MDDELYFDFANNIIVGICHPKILRSYDIPTASVKMALIDVKQKYEYVDKEIHVRKNVW